MFPYYLTSRECQFYLPNYMKVLNIFYLKIICYHELYGMFFISTIICDMFATCSVIYV